MKAGHAQSELGTGPPLRSMGRFDRNDRTAGDAIPPRHWFTPYLGLPSPRSTAALFLAFVIGMPTWNPDVASFVFVREAR
jgi:hypothetical protein